VEILENSGDSFDGSSSIQYDELSSVADEKTSHNNAPSVKKDLDWIAMPGS
jgi:hypothetical protein